MCRVKNLLQEGKRNDRILFFSVKNVGNLFTAGSFGGGTEDAAFEIGSHQSGLSS